MLKTHSKILSLGLGPRVDELINEVGVNKNQIYIRLNEELKERGHTKELSYETISRYIDIWLQEREEKVSKALNLVPVTTVDNQSGMNVVLAISEKYDDQIRSALLTATSVENGLIKAITFYSAVMTAGLAKILKDPDSVSVQDALKAAEILERIQSGKGFAKTILQNAIQINTGDRSVLKEADIIDAESFGS